MQIKEFEKKIKECKRTDRRVDSLKLKVIHYTDTNKWEISEMSKDIPERDKIILKKYNINLQQETINPLKIKFKKPIDYLTVFEAGMLYFIFIKKQITYDYASYHKCIAGKRFIENIKEIT
jgi:hypothetical protein